MPADCIVFVTIHVRPSAQAVALGAACVAAALPPDYRSRSCCLDVFPADDDSAVVDIILSHRPLAVSFSVYVWNRRRVSALARRIRTEAAHVMLIAGGPEASACCVEMQKEQLFDTIVSGEGESAVAALLRQLRQPRPAAVASIIHSKVFPLEQQQSPWLTATIQPERGVLWETSRGCPFRCSFCYDARGRHKLRTVSPQRLAAELQLFARSGVEQIWILDSTFNYPLERGKQLLRLLLQHAPDIHYHLEAKAEYLDTELVELLSRLSCSVQIGLQSARVEVLRNIRRAFDPERFAANVQLLNAAAITFGIDLIYALPGDDVAGLRYSINYALELAPNHLEVFALALLPGTELYQRQNDFSIVALKQPPYTVQSHATMSPEQMEQCRVLAAAVDIFYNTGRAVAFFLPLCCAAMLAPVALLERFAAWLQQRSDGAKLLRDSAAVSAAAATRLQQEFVAELFASLGMENLVGGMCDIIAFHACWNDAVLGEEIVPQNNCSPARIELQRHWRLADGVRLADFNYSAAAIDAMADMDVVEFVATVPPSATTALFCRYGGEVVCEEIDEITAYLLRHSDGSSSAATILRVYDAVMNDDEKRELLADVVCAGLLLPVDG